MDNGVWMVIIGVLTGVVSGMGIGGGSLLIILLVSFFGVPQLMAQGINLLYFLPTAFTALCIHIWKKRIDWKAALAVGIPGMILAAVFGLLAIETDTKIIRYAFAALVFITGMLEMFKKDPGEDEEEQKREEKSHFDDSNPLKS